MGKRVNEDLLNKIALRIKELREERNVTQEVFYHDTGINIGRIERAKRNMSISTIEEICKYLNVSVEAFFKGF